MSVNIPSIPASVDPNVRRAISELKDKLEELQKLVGTQGNTVVQLQKTPATANALAWLSSTPMDGLIYVIRNGQLEVLHLT